MTVKSSISLTDDQYSFAGRLVDLGHFRSVSAVVQQGIELLRKKMEDEALERATLAEILGNRRLGPFVSGTGMDRRLERFPFKWNRLRFHLNGKARSGDADYTGTFRSADFSRTECALSGMIARKRRAHADGD